MASTPFIRFDKVVPSASVLLPMVAVWPLISVTLPLLGKAAAEKLVLTVKAPLSRFTICVGPRPVVHVAAVEKIEEALMAPAHSLSIGACTAMVAVSLVPDLTVHMSVMVPKPSTTSITIGILTASKPAFSKLLLMSAYTRTCEV